MSKDSVDSQFCLWIWSNCYASKNRLQRQLCGNNTTYRSWTYRGMLRILLWASYLGCLANESSICIFLLAFNLATHQRFYRTLNLSFEWWFSPFLNKELRNQSSTHLKEKAKEREGQRVEYATTAHFLSPTLSTALYLLLYARKAYASNFFKLLYIL